MGQYLREFEIGDVIKSNRTGKTYVIYFKDDSGMCYTIDPEDGQAMDLSMSSPRWIRVV